MYTKSLKDKADAQGHVIDEGPSLRRIDFPQDTPVEICASFAGATDRLFEARRIMPVSKNPYRYAP